MGTATEGTLMKILKELQGLRSDLRDRGSTPLRPHSDLLIDANARAEDRSNLIDAGLLHPPIPLRPIDIRREGPPAPVYGVTEIVAKLHEEDARMRAMLPKPKPGHTWTVRLEPGDREALNFSTNETSIQLVYEQVQL